MKRFLCLLLGLGLVACDRSEKDYKARTVLQVVDGTGGGAAAIARHAELAIGGSVLERAAKALDLAERWELKDSGEAADALIGQVNSAVVAGTDLIEITVERADRTEAAEIANAIAAAFQEKMIEEDMSRRQQQIQVLESQIEAQEKQVDETRKRLLELMENAKLEGSPGQPKGLRVGAFQLAEMRTTLRDLRDLSGEELIEAAVELGLQNPTLTLRYPEYQNLKLQRQGLLDSGLGGKHPSVRSLKAQEKAMEELLLEAVDTIKGTLETQLGLAEQNLLNANEVARRGQAEKIDYLDLKKEYEIGKEMLLQRQARMASFTLIPSSLRVQIHEQAR